MPFLVSHRFCEILSFSFSAFTSRNRNEKSIPRKYEVNDDYGAQNSQNRRMVGGSVSGVENAERRVTFLPVGTGRDEDTAGSVEPCQ